MQIYIYIYICTIGPVCLELLQSHCENKYSINSTDHNGSENALIYSGTCKHVSMQNHVEK